MLTAADHRSAGRFNLGLAAVDMPLGILGIAVFLVDWYVVSLGIPGDVWWISLFPLICLIMGPVLLYRAPRHFRRAASMVRIEQGGVPAWGRYNGYSSANWSESVKQKGYSYHTGGPRLVRYIHFTVYVNGAPAHETHAEDHFPGQLESYMQRAWVPLLLDPQDKSMAAVQWDALRRAAAGQPG